MKEVTINTLSFVLLIVLIVILVLIMNKLLKNHHFFKRKKIRLTTVILASLLLYVILSNLFFKEITSEPHKKFDKKIWIKNKEKRYKMIDDLIESKYLINRSKNEVDEILGKPENRLNNDIYTYKLIDRTWSDFKIVKLTLYYKNDTVQMFKRK
jgi:hypothetical protein